jgi:hypothetical protein
MQHLFIQYFLMKKIKMDLNTTIYSWMQQALLRVCLEIPNLTINVRPI